MKRASMKERPIIFDAESVKAILAGTKTQTRRVIMPQPEETYPGADIWMLSGKAVTDEYINPVIGSDTLVDHYWHNVDSISPYGGGEYMDGTFDRLWVREVWTRFMDGIAYRADTTPFSEEQRKAYGVHWRSPIHMPRSASRITLEVVDIRVEPVMAITSVDAKAEGIDATKFPHEWLPAFAERWDSINAKRGYSWMMNPWVWVITFKRVAE